MPSRNGRIPWPLLIAAAVGIAFLGLPLVALLLKVPWSSLGALLSSREALDALRLSVISATAATALATVLGVPLAWVLARATWRTTSVLRAAVTVPLVLPPVVGGVALLYAFGRVGLVGEPLNRLFGFTIPFTTPAVVLAETFVAMPFLVVTVEGALRTLDPGYEEAAATMGASRWHIFRSVTLPLIRPALVAGGVLCWTRALGEFGATITFAGNFPGRTTTMPIEVYLSMEHNPRAGTALAAVLLLVSLGVLVALRDNWWRNARVSP